MLGNAGSAATKRLSDPMSLTLPLHLASQSLLVSLLHPQHSHKHKTGWQSACANLRICCYTALVRSYGPHYVSAHSASYCPSCLPHPVSLHFTQNSRGAFACHLLSILCVTLLFLLSQVVHSTHACCYAPILLFKPVSTSCVSSLRP